MDPLGPAAWRAAQRLSAMNHQLRQYNTVQKLRRERRQEVVRERVLRLKILQDHDRQVDRALLSDMPLHIPQAGPQARNWFLSRDMSGDTGYVLQWLGDLVKATVPDDAILYGIDEWFFKKSWQAEPFEGHPSDALHFDQDLLGRRLLWLKLVSEDPSDPNNSGIQGRNPSGNERTWGNIKETFSFLTHMRLLERFADPRNSETNQNPLPDGTNLEDGVLRASWILHRAWIRALHYRTLFAGENGYGWHQLQQILILTCAFLEAENVVITKERHRRPEFDILYTVYNTVGVNLSAFTTELFQETRPQPTDGSYSQTETILYNIRNENFEGLWIKHFAAVDKNFLLWAQLLRQAREFEKRMDVEHVEDVMIDKRIVGRDEQYELDKLLNGTHHLPDVTKMPTDISAVLDLLAEVSRRNRSRRNFLLLRDWSKKRPWHQLYYVVNTAAGEQDYLLQPIADFYTMISKLAATESTYGVTGPSPSRLSNVWAGLFTFHPIASTSPTQLQSSNYNDGCVICLDDFEHSQNIVQLHCKHLFHYNCIREYWDFPGRHTFRCAHCNQGSVNWQLHVQAGITPEVLDVWDNEDVTSQDWARLHPDIQDRDSAYHIYENHKLLLSKHWRQAYGYAPRQVACEMARVREARRKRNRERREGIKKAGTGIAGIDLPLPPLHASSVNIE